MQSDTYFHETPEPERPSEYGAGASEMKLMIAGVWWCAEHGAFADGPWSKATEGRPPVGTTCDEAFGAPCDLRRIWCEVPT